jgi:Flp pilus assembly pilin Flp
MMTLQMLWMQVQTVLNREEGQDLIEYALLVGLISLAAVPAILVSEQS